MPRNTVHRSQTLGIFSQESTRLACVNGLLSKPLPGPPGSAEIDILRTRVTFDTLCVHACVQFTQSPQITGNLRGEGLVSRLTVHTPAVCWHSIVHQQGEQLCRLGVEGLLRHWQQLLHIHENELPVALLLLQRCVPRAMCPCAMARRTTLIIVHPRARLGMN